VLGDLNDGPGRDYFEQLYLAHNVTDILAGSPYEPEQVFDDAPADTPLAQRLTSVFDDFVTDEPNKQLLLDHIAALRSMPPHSRSLQRAASVVTVIEQLQLPAQRGAVDVDVVPESLLGANQQHPQ
jgi:hypothetical protein